MAYFPDKQAIKQEIQESVNRFDLSCDHLTTTNFFTPEIAYVRDNTTREKWTNDSGVFARPLPMQLPVMGKAKLSLKTFFVPYRTLSPQWYDFITRSPHMPANGNLPVLVQEMPYFTMDTLQQLFTSAKYATQETINWDFKDANGVGYKLTAFGRKAKKTLNQLRYQIIWGELNKTPRHYNALRILAFAKVYLDYYYSNQYSLLSQDSYMVDKILKADASTPYKLTVIDFDYIFELTKQSWYSEDYFVSQWDNPTAPNSANTSFGTITLPDITMIGSNVTAGDITNAGSNLINEGRTPFATISEDNNNVLLITQYALDNLKKLTEYVQRYSLSGVRAINRYLSRFGVLLTAEKLRRSEYYGEQITNMQFGAIMSTADTTNANLGDYAGQGIINSDGQEHNHFELDDNKDLGCIMQIFTINPKIGYWQGMARENMRTDPESYFNGIFDAMGTQATSAAELYVSNDGSSAFGKESHVDNIFGYIPRQAHMKLSLDNLTGDFTCRSLNNNTLESPWHMYRTFDDTYFNNFGVVHSPAFAQTQDKEQYLRIFNYTKEEDADHFIVMIQSKVDANMHAKAVYDTYDFEGEGKRIIMQGLGPEAN